MCYPTETMLTEAKPALVSPSTPCQAHDTMPFASSCVAVNENCETSQNDAVVPPSISSGNTSTVTPQTKRLKKKRKVHFSNVQVREYALTVGTSPSCAAFPLSLDWKYSRDAKTTSIDQYEERKHQKRLDERAFTTRAKPSFKLSPLTLSERRCRLLCMGLTRQELQQHETQRRISLISEWAYGNDATGEPRCFPLTQTKTLLKHYVV